MQQAGIAEQFRTTHFAQVARARVCYHKAGDGPALVLLHGFPLSGLTWRNIVPSLAQQFTCYAFDLVGLGETTSPNAADFASDGQGRIIQQALRALGVSSYVLVGNDTGGWVARELALLEQDRVTHLALMNTEIPGHRTPWIPLYQRLVRLPGSASVMRRLLASRRFRRSPLGFGGCFENLDSMDGEFTQEFVSPLISSPGRLSAMFRFLAYMDFQRIDRFAELHGKLSMPVAFLWGEADPTFPVQVARTMAAQFPNVVQFRTVRNAKLFFHEEQPEVVAKWVTEFISGDAYPDA